MSGRQTSIDSFQVYRIGSDHSDFEPSIRLVMTGTTASSPEGALAVERISNLMNDGRHGMTVLTAYDHVRLVSAIIVIGSPGGAGLVYLPGDSLTDSKRAALQSILTHLISRPENREVTLLQVLISPSDGERASVLKASGFRYLAELIYLDRSIDRSDPCETLASEIVWQTYREQDRDLFVQALTLTYHHSLDCPGMSGIRSAAQALESHKATGIYDPNGWFLATCDNAIAGLILTSQVSHRPALEVVYMGVSPAFRGQGVGSALLQKALDEARRNEVAHVTLAVDSTNEPARRLYDRWGFREIARMKAWIAELQLRV